MNDKKQLANELCAQFADSTAEELLAHLLPRFGRKIALASSLGLEDQVLTDMIYKLDKNARVFAIDTGRLFAETLMLVDRTNLRYGTKMEVYFPSHENVEHYVNSLGINAFYEGIEQRRACCHARKLEPLRRALSTLDVWICGLRSAQSVTRSGLKKVEGDEANGRKKVNPLSDWTEDELWRYVDEHSVPVNPLHKKNFPSIGCQPCTRAVQPGEDIRAGRWWWENPEHKECGLHKR